MRYYIGLIQKEPDSDFGVSFPDFPGVVTAGKSLGEAVVMAHEALALHVEGMVEDGMAIPEPSTVDAIKADPDNEGAVAIVGLETSSKTVRVNVTFPQHLLEQIDRFAEAHGQTRAGFLALAAKHEIEHSQD
jgi:predicted RNase H-like HicB family nuclease